MADIELVVKLDEVEYINIRNAINSLIENRVEYSSMSALCLAILDGIPLPKGHGDLFDRAEILRFLRCPEYENCDWKDCFDCNESRCINLNNINDLVPIIPANTSESEELK